MCCRFYYDALDEKDPLLEMMNRAALQHAGAVQDAALQTGEYGPGDQFPVIALSRGGNVSAFMMRWGFQMPDKKPAEPVSFEQLRMDIVPPPAERTSGKLVINARSETAMERAMFRESMEKRRCLIPACAYFEWDHRQKTQVKYRFQPVGEPMFCLAALYRWREDGQGLEFTVLTRDASPDVDAFHDRMPVMLPRALMRDWLDPRNPPENILREALTRVTYQPV